MGAPKNLGVYSLEGRWSINPLYSWSVTPILELLARERRIRYRHHRVKRARRLRTYAEEFTRLQGYHVLYIATHGEPGLLDVGLLGASVDELGEQLAGRCEGRVIFFACCHTVQRRQQMERFRERSGARMVIGYRRQVDTIQAAAFDLLVLDALAGNGSKTAAREPMRRAGTRLGALERRHRSLVKHLGFVRY